jgi:hypothetical protein
MTPPSFEVLDAFAAGIRPDKRPNFDMTSDLISSVYDESSF